MTQAVEISSTINTDLLLRSFFTSISKTPSISAFLEAKSGNLCRGVVTLFFFNKRGKYVAETASAIAIAKGLNFEDFNAVVSELPNVLIT